MAIAGHPGNMQRGVHYDKTCVPCRRREGLLDHHAMVAQARFDGELEWIWLGLTQEHRARWFGDHAQGLRR